MSILEMKKLGFLFYVVCLVILSCSRPGCSSLPENYSSYEQAQSIIRNAEFPIAEKMNTAKSSWIRAAEFYSCDRKTGFFILVTDSKDYIFQGMPVEVWEEFKQADSYGKFYHAHIKNRYYFELSNP